MNKFLSTFQTHIQSKQVHPTMKKRRNPIKLMGGSPITVVKNMKIPVKSNEVKKVAFCFTMLLPIDSFIAVVVIVVRNSLQCRSFKGLGLCTHICCRCRFCCSTLEVMSGRLWKSMGVAALKTVADSNSLTSRKLHSNFRLTNK